VNGKRLKSKILVNNDIVSLGDAELVYLLQQVRNSRPTGEVVMDKPALPRSGGSSIVRRYDADTITLTPTTQSSDEKQVERYRNALNVVYKISNQLASEESIDRLCHVILEAAIGFSKADRGSLLLLEKAGDVEILDARVTLNSRGAVPPTSDEFFVSKSIVSQVIDGGVSVILSDAQKDDRFSAQESVVMQSIRSVLCVPIQSQQTIHGVIYLDARSASGLFYEHELELLTAIGKQAGIALERARLFNQLQSLFYDTIQTLVEAIEAKDVYTRGHSERVSAYAMLLGERLELTDTALASLRLGALLHDIGKIGISEKILCKPTRLTPEEFDIIKTHPAKGAAILQNLKGVDDVREMVRHHHEKWNGSGYPDGLAGEDIPWTARILAVADAYDAMTSNRAYRRNFSSPEVVAEFRRCAGDQFDEKVSDVLSELLEAGVITPHA
jgi:putative nucleotidyltransferase with HDIG domain